MSYPSLNWTINLLKSVDKDEKAEAYLVKREKAVAHDVANIQDLRKRFRETAAAVDVALQASNAPKRKRVDSESDSGKDVETEGGPPRAQRPRLREVDSNVASRTMSTKPLIEDQGMKPSRPRRSTSSPYISYFASAKATRRRA